jgi:hypothetical protein
MQEEEGGHGDDHTLNLRQTFDEGEAVQVYIEYLCHCHMKEGFAEKVLRAPSEPTHARYLAAARQLEDKMCTVRESLLGSGAWAGKGKEFTWDLQQRPFYATDASNYDRLMGSHAEYGDYGVCAACARPSKIPPQNVYLFGAEYDARAVWNRRKWHLEMPPGVFLHEKIAQRVREREEAESGASAAADKAYGEGGNGGGGGDSDDGSAIEPIQTPHGAASSSSSSSSSATAASGKNEDGDSGSGSGSGSDSEDEGYSDVEQAPAACQWWLRKWPGDLTRGKETSWSLSGHCRGRTQLYHALLHYKLRLLLKVRDKLERVYGNIGDVVADRSFNEGEAERLENLMELATKGFGGKGMEDAAVRRVSGVWADGSGDPTPAAGAASGSNTKASTKRSATSMLQWLGKKGAAGGGGAQQQRQDSDSDA